MTVSWMVELSVIRDLVAIFGVLAGLTYYILTVRNADKARKIQLLMQLREAQRDTEYLKGVIEVSEAEWEDYEDFKRKYHSTINPDHWVKRFKMWNFMDGIGYLLKQNLIDMESAYHLMQGTYVIMSWFKWGPVIEKQREEMGPDYMIWFEYLADEMSKMRERRGLSSLTSS